MSNTSPRPTFDLEQNFDIDKENSDQNLQISNPHQDADNTMIGKAVADMETSATFLSFN